MRTAPGPVVRIDAHQHYWRYDPAEYPWIGAGMDVLRRDCLPAQAAVHLDAHGFDAAIAVQARCSEAETEWLLALAREDAHIAGVVGWVDLAAENVAERLAHWGADPALRGIRHIVQDDPDPAATLADAAFGRGVRATQDAGLVYEVLVHAPDLPAAIDFCARHDRHWLVLDHLGKPAIVDAAWQPWAGHLAELARLPHVMCKLSGLVTEAGDVPDRIGRYAAHALDCFGPGRTMFGSDWPVCRLAAEYDAVCVQAESAAAGLAAGEREQLFGGTATRCYGLRDDAGNAQPEG